MKNFFVYKILKLKLDFYFIWVNFCDTRSRKVLLPLLKVYRIIGVWGWFLSYVTCSAMGWITILFFFFFFQYSLCEPHVRQNNEGY